MKNIPISGKLFLILVAFGMFVLGTALYTTGKMRQIGTGYTDAASGPATYTLYTARSSGVYAALRATIMNTTLARNAAEMQAADSEMAATRARFVDFTDHAEAAYPPQAASMQSLASQATNFVDQTCASTINLAHAAIAAQPATAIGGPTPAASQQASQAAFVADCNPAFPAISNLFITTAGAATAASQNLQTNLATVTTSTIRITFAIVLSGLVLILTAAYFGIRIWVTSPMNRLCGVMERMARGDLAEEVEGKDRNDEIGRMARALQVFKEAGIEKTRLEAEAAAQRAAAEYQRQSVEAERATSAREQEFVVGSVATGLKKLSGGDLVFRLTTPFSGDYDQLRGDFNAAMERLQETMQAIASNTQAVRSGADEITQASDDLSRRTEQQAASLEETAAALDQITATVRKTAEGAGEARNVVSSAKADAERSGDVVRETVGAMSGIESSSKQITNIIGVIDEIAFQTNLLALNAGVEAARAGDAGRGFAVVATEVRALAQRSADAAKEIKALISASGQQVDVGVKLVGETGKALARIVEQVARLNDLVSDIAASAQEQATGLHQVNAAVNQMDQVTQQNAAMVEQSTAASYSLAEEATTLSRLVDQFQTGPAGRTPPKTRAQTFVPTAKAPVPPRQSAAPRLAVAGAEDNWDEF
jgi:methyl-accepting chemotaxis protein